MKFNAFVLKYLIDKTIRKEILMKASKTLILVADGENVLFYKNEGIGKGIERLEKEYHQDIPKGKDIVTDRPGLDKMTRGVKGIQSSAAHGYEPSDNPREEMKIRFLRDAMDKTEKHLIPEYEKLIVIAPPQILGEIRKMLNDAAKNKIIGQVDKNLTRSAQKDIEKNLNDILAY